MIAARATNGPAVARRPTTTTWSLRRPPPMLLARRTAAAATDAAAATAAAVFPTPGAGDDAAPLLARLAALGPSIAVDAGKSDAPVDDLAALLRPSSPDERVAFIAMSHAGDLTSHELAQRLARRVLPALAARRDNNNNDDKKTTTTRFVVAVLGTPSAARLFARDTGLAAAADAPGSPQVVLLATQAAQSLYRRALGFEPGFAPDQEQVSPYAKLLVMLAGLGSDRGATIKEVLRGYLGDKNADAVFFDREWTPFDVLGKGYQRPFELATQRLFNMGTVLSKWNDLAPKAEGEEGALLIQQGGAIVFAAVSDNGGVEVAFAHRDAGILCYVDTDALTTSLLV